MSLDDPHQKPRPPVTLKQLARHLNLSVTTVTRSLGDGHKIGADTILAFFGFNESFDGLAGLEKFSGELSAFVDHTLSQPYNGRRAPRLVLVSPIAFEDLSSTQDLPDGRVENTHLERYTAVMREVAAAKGVGFIDLFSLTRTWYAETPQPLTINGAHLSDAGYRKLAPALLERLYGPGEPVSTVDPEACAPPSTRRAGSG